MIRFLTLLCIAFLCTTNSWAQNPKTETTNTNVETTSIDQFSQEFWGLTNDEWAQYEQIKSIAKSLGQAETTPVEVLGIFAKTESERKRFAQAYVKRMDAYVANLQHFQRVTSEIQSQHYKDIPMLDPDRINQIMDSPMRSNDRVQFFTKLNCSSCDLILLKLIRQVRMYGSNLDVFFDDATVAEVQQYSKDKKVPENLVATGQVTLNIDNGYIAKYKIKTPAPYISKAGGALKHHDPDL